MFQKRISSVSPSCQPLLSPALLQSYVDGSVRDVLLCSGMGGNERCRKDSPCSTRAEGSMYPRPARLRLRAALPTPAPACVLRGKRRSRTPCRMTMRGGPSSLLSMPASPAPPGNGHGPCGAAIRSASMARWRSRLRRSRQFQHYSTTERIQFHSLPCLKSIVYLSCSKCIICI